MGSFLTSQAQAFLSSLQGSQGLSYSLLCLLHPASISELLNTQHCERAICFLLGISPETLNTGPHVPNPNSSAPFPQLAPFPPGFLASATCPVAQASGLGVILDGFSPIVLIQSSVSPFALVSEAGQGLIFNPLPSPLPPSHFIHRSHQHFSAVLPRPPPKWCFSSCFL